MIFRKPRIKILYVEDNVMIQSTMMSFMSEYNFELLIADNGQQAINLIFDENLSIDALVTDVNLGAGANGWEVARCARLRASEMPVVYTSSVSHDEWLANAVPSSRLCLKPFRPSHILESITALLPALAVDAQAMPAQNSPAEGEDLRPPEAANPKAGKDGVEEAANQLHKAGLGRKFLNDRTPGVRALERTQAFPNRHWIARHRAEMLAAFPTSVSQASKYKMFMV